MTQENQRIAIAEALGYAFWHSQRRNKLVTPGTTLSPTWKPGFAAHLPVDFEGGHEYLSSRDAIHAAIMTLDDWEQGADFDNHLFRILNRDKRELGVGHEGVSTFDKIRAPAPQLVEAFLRTVNLWTDA